MISEHLTKYRSNYLLILFVGCSFLLRLVLNKTGLDFYYILAVILIILGFTRYSVANHLDFSCKLLTNKIFYIYQIPGVVLSNIILLLILKDYLIREIQTVESEPLHQYMLGFFFFNSIRIFGEEFIFRAFLLINVIKQNKILFWVLNFVQAFLFSIVHYFIAQDLTNKVVFAVYVFAAAFYFGWLNRKFDSLLPGWTIHWLNGLQTLLMAAIFHL
jgi:hypothetical protein